MIVFTMDDLTRAVSETSARMDQNKQRLIDLDSQIGDGDLGLTMSRGFLAAKECANSLTDSDISTRFKKIGFSISKAVPSTMGTLMATMFLGAGKSIDKKVELDSEDFSKVFMGMAVAVQERGKAKEGDKTILDVLFPVARAVQSSECQDITELMQTALTAARESFEAAKSLMNQHGKAAVFREKTIGMEDPGCAAVLVLIEAFAKTCGVSV